MHAYSTVTATPIYSFVIGAKLEHAEKTRAHNPTFYLPPQHLDHLIGPKGKM